MDYEEMWGRREQEDGRAYTREQLRFLEDVNALTKDGKKYLDGSLERLGGDDIAVGVLLLVVALGFTCIIMLTVARISLRDGGAALFFMLFLGLFAATGAYTTYQAVRKYQRYHREGVHLLGKVVSSRVMTRGSGRSRRLVVEVTYRFRTPQGKMLTKTHDLPLHATWNIFKGGLFAPLNERYLDQLIAPETKVAVLYVDEKLARLL